MAEATAAPLESYLGQLGCTAFRPGQQQIVQAVMEGHDVLVVMPTGGGKSLCYQLPSLARDGVTLVISPLIALMKDQVDSLVQRGVRATLINSSLSPGEQQQRSDAMRSGAYDLVYVAPERLRHSRFLETIESTQVALLAVDEAHCVSEWGHDFRPDYSRIGAFRQRYLRGVQTIALTATATPTVRTDIRNLLQLKQPQEFITGFARQNLFLQVESVQKQDEKDQKLLEFISRRPGTGIIYAATRKKCDELAEWLPKRLRRPIGVYHAGMPQDQRKGVQEAFMTGKLSAIVATNAFGMGVDKADIRWVVHYNLPGSIEAYYQEAGRAGRDGSPSECLLLFMYGDRYLQEFFIENKYPTADLVEKVYEFLHKQPQDPIELTLEEVRERAQLGKVSTEAISTAESLLAKTNVLQRLDGGSGTATLRIDSELATLIDLLPPEARVRRQVLKQCELIVAKRRYEDVPFRLERLVERCGMDREAVVRALRELSRLQAFDYVPPFRGRAVHFRRRDVPFGELKIDFKELEKRKRAEFEKLEQVMRLARTGSCRQREILDYFGQTSRERCDFCDRCRPMGIPLPAQSAAVASVATAPNGAAVAAAAAASSAHDANGAATGITATSDGAAKQVTDAVGMTQTGAALVASVSSERYRGELQRIASRLLQAAGKTHGRIGKVLLVQMLTGSQSQKLQGLKLHRSSGYGLLSGLRQTEVQQLIDALLACGLMEQREINFHRPTIHVTEQGEAVANDPQKLPESFRLLPPLIVRATKALAASSGAEGSSDGQGEGSSSEPGADRRGDRGADGGVDGGAKLEGNPSDGAGERVGGAADAAIVESLRSWRRDVADELGLPAYRVLNNAALQAIAVARPDSIEALARMGPVGAETVDQFGADIIARVQRASQSADREVAGLPEPPRQAIASKEPALQTMLSAAERATDLSDATWTLRVLQSGFGLDDCAAIRRRPVASLVDDLVLLAGGAERPAIVGLLRGAMRGALDEASRQRLTEALAASLPQ
jgi:ATP-dependent DNA helicase RecQ